MKHSKLQSYDLQRKQGNQMLVLMTGDKAYKEIVQRAFPNLHMSRTFEDRTKHHQWGSFIYDADSLIEDALRRLLELCRTHVYLQNDLTETFALDYHTKPIGWRQSLRTEIGRLVYRAKPYARSISTAHYLQAQALAKRFQAFITQHPRYQQCDMVISIPPSQANKRFDLPAELARHLTVTCGMELGTNNAYKNRSTRPMKDCRTHQEKEATIRGAFSLREPTHIRGKQILLLDDIYDSGCTMNEVARTLSEAGATAVFGLVATKTSRDL